MTSIKDVKEFLEAIEALAEEKDISKDIVISALKNAIIKAYNKDIDPEALVQVDIDLDNGSIRVFQAWEVVNKEEVEAKAAEKSVVIAIEGEEMYNEEEVQEVQGFNPDTQMSLEEAREKDVKLGLGDFYREEIKLSEVLSLFGYTQIKQVMKQLTNESAKESIYKRYADKKDTIMFAQIDTIENDRILVELEKTKGYLPPVFQVRGEKLRTDEPIPFYVQDVLPKSKGWQVILSRTSPQLVRLLFEKEVPEISDGDIEIKAVARDAGSRTKIAVYSNNPNIDPIGACIGQKGARTKAVSSQINNEKIDIVRWDADPVKFICNSMAPAKCIAVNITDDEKKESLAIVPDSHLSLAIGKRGSTAKLATWLTNWKIEIKSLTQAFEEGINFETNGNISVTEAKNLSNKNAGRDENSDNKSAE